MFRLNIKESFFTEKMDGCWSRVPREVVVAPSLTEFKWCLDELSYILVLGSPRRSRELG